MLLSVDGISVTLGKTPILRDAKLFLDAGEIVRLVGRNGAGKTTFMRAVMGLVDFRGNVVFEGTSLERVPSYRRAPLGIGYMPEDRKLVPEFTAEENILFPAWAMKRLPDEVQLRRIYQLMPELSSILQRRAISLSGGQQKLVALARALHCGTKLLLLDEPFEGIAPALSKRLEEIIQTARTADLTVLVSESDYTRSARLANYSAPIERGFIGEKTVIVKDEETAEK